MLLVAASSSVRPSAFMPAYDVAVALREAGVATIGGFHTFLEKECLDILLRGSQSVTICPARIFANGHRIYGGALWNAVGRGLAEGRVHIQPPPGVRGTRITRQNAEIRNTWLLKVADQALILVAAVGSQTEALARRAIEQGMPVFVMDHPANAHLLAAGAAVWTGPGST